MRLLRVRYGTHLSKEQVAELVEPHQDTLELVHSWLERHGVPSSSISTSHGGGWLTIAGVPVSQADELLSASYQLYRHTRKNETEVILRTVSYALPAALHALVRTVAPTTLFTSPRMPLQTPRKRSSEEAAVMVNSTSGEFVRMLSRRDDDDSDDEEDIVRPEFLRRLYKTKGYVPAAGGQNKLGILGLQNEYPSLLDLLQFMANFRTDAVAAIFSVELINGGRYNRNQPGQEASLDIQYTAAIAYPTPQIFYSTGGLLRWTNDDGEPAPDDPYLVWLDFLLNLPDIPQTILIAYGNPEQVFPREYATSLCNLFARLGARGVSIIVSTGDEGIGRGDCKDSSGNVRFISSFPASCTCGDLSLLARSTQPQEVAHQTATVLQVPLSLVSVARRATTPRSRITSPRAASHATFRARATRTARCPPTSSTSATSMLASTSAFAVVI